VAIINTHTKPEDERTRGERAIRLLSSGPPPLVEGHSSKDEGGNSSFDEWPSLTPLLTRGPPPLVEGHSSKVPQDDGGHEWGRATR